ncbi:glutamate-5-semialdehyde dehydrogenase [Wohlfahrtiimonas chitiniclastica]|uniref:glutamate-5-semialdehyde dehydrogenase n=1 Tax=Wohlfahrtiimonas chitiniclastica TaxID=400946 RepID=UPI001BCF01D7|nr:glutamate-5-semialdehyde dehydrogenase [Wohlfahrtiimonas chitiniclastica]MBS7821200.1 glutamate-5-semialdehyde dehydrogenase [Wohlfahrtiimonas chitiniclastica]
MAETLQNYWDQVGQQARAASRDLLRASTAEKNRALQLIHDEIMAHIDQIMVENQKDCDAARANGLAEAFIDRLLLDDARIRSMASGVLDMIALPDPVGEVTDVKPRPSGIMVGKMRVPLGVIGIIYESRPNVTIDAAALCLKSGNAAILRGGSDAFYTNQYLATLLSQALADTALSEHSVQIVATKDRNIVDLMVTAKDYIDVIIPRGGNSLVARINDQATVPVIKHLDGICHTFVDEFANIDLAVKVVDNAKTQRYAPCNALETLLVHEKVAAEFLPKIAVIFTTKMVEMRACDQSYEILSADFNVTHATESDWRTEYLAPIVSIKVVKDLDEAITHINHYGSHHTDVIISEHYTHTTTFLRLVDSACVMVNASSRFCDGFEFGLGAEIGISTDKIHARGPVGLEGLTSQKYVVLGHGEIRS